MQMNTSASIADIAVSARSRADEERFASAASALSEAGQSGDLSRLEAAAREFEAVFITEMLKPMFSGLEVDPMFGGGKGEEIFRGMMLTEYGKMLSQTGGIGIAEKVQEELIRIQEAQGGKS